MLQYSYPCQNQKENIPGHHTVLCCVAEQPGRHHSTNCLCKSDLLIY